MKYILFVCMGNLCRSPIAEAIATDWAARRGLSKRITFASAGTHPPRKGEPADPRARLAGARRGYDLSEHRARRIELADFSRFDRVFAMDRDNLAVLRALCPPVNAARLGLFLEALDDAALTEVPDPYFGGTEGFERVVDVCEAGIEALFRQGWRLDLE